MCFLGPLQRNTNFQGPEEQAKEIGGDRIPFGGRNITRLYIPGFDVILAANYKNIESQKRITIFCACLWRRLRSRLRIDLEPLPTAGGLRWQPPPPRDRVLLQPEDIFYNQKTPFTTRRVLQPETKPPSIADWSFF